MRQIGTTGNLCMTRMQGFRFACRANHNYKLAPSRASSEGRFAIVTKRWARDAMDASAQKANELEADGEAVWS